MVVQCPTCQSKFRIADEKVTYRGVRVRCTACKNVFQVKKPGAAGADPGPDTTMDLSALGASAVTKAGAGSRPSHRQQIAVRQGWLASSARPPSGCLGRC